MKYFWKTLIDEEVISQPLAWRQTL